MADGLATAPDVEVVVLQDHADEDAELFVLGPDGRDPVGSWPEGLSADPDTGDPATLEAFLAWGLHDHPADRTVLVLWDHGGGWSYFAHDDGTGSRMSIPGLADAIEGGEDSGEGWIDVAIFDACDMAMAEVAWELVGVTDQIVASTHTVDSDGFPYDLSIARLAAAEEGPVDPGDFAEGVADDYLEVVGGTNAKSSLSVAAIHTAGMEAVKDAVDDLAIALEADARDLHGAIGSARANAEHQTFGAVMGVFWYIDLWRFADTIAKQTDLDAEAGAVQDAVEDAVYAKTSDNLDGFSHGLTIDFPSSLARYEGSTSGGLTYDEVGLAFTADTAWDEMLLAFYRGKDKK
jgi:hypothetical protein